MLDDVLAEIVERAGGVNALAAALRITAQAVHKWRQFGIPEHRVNELEKISGIPREKIRRYSQRKQTERRAGLEWWEPTSSRSEHYEPEPRPEPGPPSAELIRQQWFLYRAYRHASPCLYPDPPPYPEPPPPPFRAAEPIAFATFRLIILLDYPHIRNHLGFTVPVHAQLMSCARHLYEGKPFHLRPQNTYPPTPQGTWFDTRTVESFRIVARFFAAREVAVNDATVFFPRGHSGEIG
jgi:hypothetical protein